MREDTSIHFGWTVYWAMAAQELTPEQFAPKMGLRSGKQVKRIIASSLPPRDLKRKVAVAKALQFTSWAELDAHYRRTRVPAPPKLPPDQDVNLKRKKAFIRELAESAPAVIEEIADGIDADTIADAGRKLSDLATELKDKNAVPATRKKIKPHAKAVG